MKTLIKMIALLAILLCFISCEKDIEAIPTPSSEVEAPFTIDVDKQAIAISEPIVTGDLKAFGWTRDEAIDDAKTRHAKISSIQQKSLPTPLIVNFHYYAPSHYTNSGGSQALLWKLFNYSITTQSNGVKVVTGRNNFAGGTYEEITIYYLPSNGLEDFSVDCLGSNFQLQTYYNLVVYVTNRKELLPTTGLYASWVQPECVQSERLKYYDSRGRSAFVDGIDGIPNIVSSNSFKSYSMTVTARVPADEEVCSDANPFAGYRVVDEPLMKVFERRVNNYSPKEGPYFWDGCLTQGSQTHPNRKVISTPQYRQGLMWAYGGSNYKEGVQIIFGDDVVYLDYNNGKIASKAIAPTLTGWGFPFQTVGSLEFVTGDEWVKSPGLTVIGNPAAELQRAKVVTNVKAYYCYVEGNTLFRAEVEFIVKRKKIQNPDGTLKPVIYLGSILK